MTKRKTKCSNSSTPKKTLKLLVDKKSERVLFAEAPKEFVDFLFHIFSLPLGTLIEFLGSNQMVGCLGKLKDSIENLHENYLQFGIETDDIFNPITSFCDDTFLLSYDDTFSEDQSGAGKKKKKKRGYVKKMVTYMVMDDLVVKPMSTISGITIINKFGVKDLSQLEEKTVSFGQDKVVKLLGKTHKVLTTIFMH